MLYTCWSQHRVSEATKAPINGSTHPVDALAADLIKHGNFRHALLRRIGAGVHPGEQRDHPTPASVAGVTQPQRFALRSRALAASISRFFGGAVVSSESTSRRVAFAISITARSNGSMFDTLGLRVPLTLRTYCKAAAWISSSVAGGSKLNSGRML